ncbi:gluconolaconase [Kitasatospora sp. NPDC006697]|uniref:gluconolaconase n=1 Tax=Kitasatospora sp. NPDC006697 TaxID=3364020 RepID=UPI00368469C6
MTGNQFSRRTALVAGLAAAGALVAAGPAAAAASGEGYGPVLHGHGEDLHPESAGWDPAGRRFVISSLHQGTVSTVGPDGVARTLVADPELVSVVGLKVDAARGRVLACNADPAGRSVRSTAATQGRVSGLGCYDLAGGRRRWYTDLAAVAGDGGPHLANDVVVAEDGTAYVTDSFAPVVYRVGVDGRAEVLLRLDVIGAGPGQFGLNGIVLQGRQLLVGTYATGAVWRLPLDRAGRVRPQDVRPVIADRRLLGLDGLLGAGPGRILGVTNTLGAATTDQLVELRSTDGWRTALPTVRSWPDPAPTAVTRGPGGRHYVLSGRMDVLLGGGLSEEFTLRRI